MRYLIAFGAILSLALPMGASAQSQPGSFTLTGYSQTFDGSAVQTAKKNKLLTAISVSPTDAVQLGGDVPAEIIEVIGTDGKSPMVSGKILLSWGRKGVYCGQAKFALDRVAPCLVDQDNDGRFEKAFKAMDPAGGYPQGLVMYHGLPMGSVVLPQTVSSLTVPVPYKSADSSALPRTSGELIWQSDYKRGQSGPVKILFGFEAKRALLNPMTSHFVEVTFEGAPVEANLNGLIVTVENIGPDGSLTYRLRGEINSTPIVFTVEPHIFRWTF